MNSAPIDVKQLETTLVSIGLPVASEPVEYIEDAIKSIFAQSYQHWELIIVCDGSPSGTLEFLYSIDDPRVSIIENPRRFGLARNLNIIASAARGEYLFRMDADDYSHPERIKIQLGILASHGHSIDILTSQMVLLDQEAEPIGYGRRTKVPEKLSDYLGNTPLPHATLAAKTSVMRSHPYDETLIRSQDRGFWMDVAGSCRLFSSEDYLYLYRVNALTSYKRYSQSMRFVRRAIRVHGVAIATKPRIIWEIIRSYFKQYLVLVLKILRLDRLLYRKKMGVDSSFESATWSTIIKIIRETKLPIRK